ncbi:hypothetical protein [Dyadobacter sp. CY323]|uniref:hypothetical protein n=1 Tax=Dyadobacter sp. CY323 TaxID=2907302 RepID=UPI001F49101D|nr:hypothetical protein [Dyadobacter sp. CY323]MCE6990447.1 hypothetical protein [Dyadobacter sp. CY323]
MKDNERISNPEEFMAEFLHRLDRWEDGQTELRFGQKSLHTRIGSLEEIANLLNFFK